MPISISLVIPVYNRERFVCEALDSVAAQTRLPDEIIVVDDGSTDRSVALINGWIRAHSTINCRLIRQRNEGAAAARNTGISNATGEYIAFLDSDDLWMTHCVETLAGVMERCPEELVMCVGDKKIVETNDGHNWIVQEESVFNDALLNRMDLKRDDLTASFIVKSGLFENLLPGTFLTVDSTLVRKKAAVAAGLFPTQFKTSEDRLFFLRIARAGKVALIDKPLSINRLHDHNLTSDAANLEVAKNGLAALEFVLESFELNPRERSRVLELIKLYRENLRYCASTKGKAYLQFALSRLIRKHDVSFFYDVRSIARAIVVSCGMRKQTRGGDGG